MKKEGVIIAFLIILLLSFSLVSASWFDWLKNVFSKKPLLAPEEGLVAYYNLDEIPQTHLGIVGDNSGNKNTGKFISNEGTINKAVSGMKGSALDLDGKDDYIIIPKEKALINGTNGFSIAGWIKPKNLETMQNLIAWKNQKSAIQFVPIDGSGNFGIWACGSWLINSSYSYKTGEWYYVVWTRNLDEWRYYVNGELITSIASRCDLETPSLDYYIGAEATAPSQFFSGLIDEIKIYNKALSQKEIKKEYNYYNPSVCTDSDGGINYSVKGIYKGRHDSTAEYTSYMDSCLDNKLSEGYCGEDGFVHQEDYTCPNGCEDGACIKEECKEKWECSEWGECKDGNLIRSCKDSNKCGTTENKPTEEIKCIINCTDSDNGINYSVKGYVNGKGVDNYYYENQADICLNVLSPQGGEVYSSNYIAEGYCENDLVNFSIYTCPNGCKDGACLEKPEEEPQICQDLIERVKNPSDFVDGDVEYNFLGGNNYTDYLWIDGEKQNVTEYKAFWDTDRNNRSIYIAYSVIVVNDKNINLVKWLENMVSYDVCVPKTYLSANNKENKVYVCNWDVLLEEQNLNSYKHKSREILWTNKNVLVEIGAYIKEYSTDLTDEEINKLASKRISEFLNDLEDNREKYVKSENFEIDYPLSRQIEKSLLECPSEIPLETCEPCWECKIEPVICPPHGYQKQTCRDRCCDKHEAEIRRDCSPGICSGCIVPRWLMYEQSGDNICIPYGTRFIYEEGERERIEEGYFDEAPLTFLSENEAILELIGETKNYTYTLHKGEELIIKDPEHEEIEFKVRVEKIVFPTEKEKGYVELFFRKEFKAYCNYDGEIGEQKTQDKEGDWAKCQNNYECESNVCSSGECYDIKGMFKEVSGMKSLGIKILCRLAGLFRIEKYGVCLANYLGK